MLISYNWLKEFVKIPPEITPQKLGELLTMHTVEVEGIIKPADRFQRVVVGEILAIKPHPAADRLQLAEVQVAGGEKLEIVCGAPNIAVGQKVPVALAGATLPNGLKIEKTKIRGVVSQGMLCAEDELGLGDDHSGILILDANAKVGEPFAQYLGWDDVVLEIDNKSLSNRPDLWGHLGLAREVAAILKSEFFSLTPAKFQAGDKDIAIEVKNKELCPRYMAIELANIKIAPSPTWLQERLLALGMRPINNIVDITNYVMLETGQPLHAFDRQLVDKIVVRSAKAQEKIITLDGKERQLEEGMLVIADSNKPIAIAGVMGGENSEVRPQTQTIILEAANFDPVSLRRTAQKLGLRTESSSRFEKGLDPTLCELGLLRAVELIKRVCPQARVSSQVQDITNYSISKTVIKLSPSFLENILGIKVDLEETKILLNLLGFKIKFAQEWEVEVPSWRQRDVQQKEDLAEEVARILGFNQIPSSLPRLALVAPPPRPAYYLEKKLKYFFKGIGLVEVYNYSFVAEDWLKKLEINTSSHLRLLNPLSKERTLLRQSLIPNLLENIKLNQSRFEAIRLFEIGQVYLPLLAGPDKGEGEGKLPYQEKRIGLVWSEENYQLSWSKLKGALERLGKESGILVEFFSPDGQLGWAERGWQAQIIARLKDKRWAVGTVAVVQLKILRRLGIKKEVVAAEINFGEWLDAYQAAQNLKTYQPLPKFPPAVRDLAFVVDRSVSYQQLKDFIVNFHPLIAAVELFDVYEGERVGKNKKSLAFHLTLQADYTLTTQKIDEVQASLVQAAKERFGARLRDF